MFEIKVSRYINVPVLLSPDGDYIPIWDSRLQFTEGIEEGIINDKDYVFTHPSLSVKDIDNYVQFELTEVIFDLMTKNLFESLDIDLYPSSNKFEVGEEVYIKDTPKVISKGIIKGVIYKDSTNVITKGRYINEHDLECIKKQQPNFKVNPEYIYCINRWYPRYVLTDGRVIEFDSNIYKKKDTED